MPSMRSLSVFPLAGLAITLTSVPAGALSPEDIGGWGTAWEIMTPTQTEAPSPLVSAAPVAARKKTEGAAQTPTAPPPLPSQGKPLAKPSGKQTSALEPGKEPVHLVANEMIHDKERDVVTAKGKVEIVQETGRSLYADSVSYNIKQDVISASGNVVVVETTGDVAFSDYAELTGDMKEGVAQVIRLRLSDRSTVKAKDGQRTGGAMSDFNDASYTACEPCRKDPQATPLWTVNAEHVKHDQVEHMVEYDNAWIELGGLPVFYTPYLSHPDPTVKRKSGFLVPTPGLSSNLGANITIPYFWAIEDNQDFTFSPRLLFPEVSPPKSSARDGGDSVLERVVLAGTHRWRGQEGETLTTASITANRDGGTPRGHVDARGEFDLDEMWRAGYQIQRASDGTYMSLYGFPIPAGRPWLTSRPYVEAFGQYSYGVAEMFAFQGLRHQDRLATTPLVFPHIAYDYRSDPSRLGGYWNLQSDFLSYTRREGVDATRITSTMGWTLPLHGPLGDHMTLTTSLRGDGYASGDLEDGQSDATTGRALPQVAFNWRLPFIKDTGLVQTIEPEIMIAASPIGGNPKTIPDEDSIGFELDEANVFRANRLPGYDRVEGGLRGAYGLHWTAYPAGGSVRASVAQGWRAHLDDTFNQGHGFDGRLSDYVGSFDVMPSPFLSLRNRARLDRKTGELQRSENSLTLGDKPLRARVSYLKLSESTEGEEVFPRREYLSYGLQSALTENWSAGGNISHDLSNNGGLLGWDANVSYEDECFALVTRARQRYTSDRDFESGFELKFNVVFKTLGSVPLTVF